MFYKKPLTTAILIAFGAMSQGNALAQEADESSGQLEVIEVKAQKRVQKFMEVPVAVTTVSGEILDAAQATEFQDLVQVSPSVTFNQSGDMRGSGVNIRGIGTSAFQTAVEPTVSTVIDGIPLGRTVQFLSDLADIDRVEVLRGPQGTLFGKNASAGVVSVYTKRPEDSFFGEVRLTAADDDAFGIMGQVTGPISDDLKGRMSYYYRDFDGFVDNLSTGETINGDKSRGVRGKLEYDISMNDNLYIIADYSKQDRDCCVSVLQSIGRGSLNDLHQLGEDYADVDIKWGNNKTLVTSDGYSNTETAGVSAEYNHTLDDFTFTSVTGYRGFTLETAQDPDQVGYQQPVTGHVLFTKNGASGGGDQSQSQFSQELRLAGQVTDQVFLTVGAFYWEQTVKRYFEREVMRCADPYDPQIGTQLCSDEGSGIGFTSMDSQVDTTNYAVFGQVDWDITEDFSASLGLRYTKDDISFDFERTEPTITGPFDSLPALPGSGDVLSNETDDSALTGRLALTYDINDNIMAFASYAEGYKSPAFDLIFSLNESRTAPVPAETSEAWEAGLRSELFDRRLRLSVTGFHTTFDNFQGQAFDPDTVIFSLTSAGEVITEGVEIEFNAKPVPELFLSGGIALIDATYGTFLDQQCYFQQTEAQGCIDGFQSINGGDVPNSPDTKITLSGKYDIYLDGDMDMFVSANYRWQDEVMMNQNQAPYLLLPSYGVLDLTVGLQADDGKWVASIFAKNALDDMYVAQIGTAIFDQSNISAQLTRDFQRYIGAQFTYRFGSY